MPTPVETRPGQVSFPVNVTLHARAAAAASAALAAKVTIPSYKASDGVTVYPKMVRMQVEKAAAADTFYTLDGNAASATNGIQLPTAPDYEDLPYPDLLRNHVNGAVSASNPQICLFSAGANVQCLFFF